MPDILIVDGPHMLYRAVFAHGDLSYERKGVVHHIGGVYGFINMIRRAHAKHGGMVMVAWEDPRRHVYTHRRNLYPDYKLKRKDDEEVDYGLIEMRKFAREQQGLVNDFMGMLGCLQAYAPEWEADDVIATVCRQLAHRKITVLSGDKDLFALLTPNVQIMRPDSGNKGDYVIHTVETWGEEHLVTPEQYSIVLALAGDKSDNVPGVQGIGPKFAERIVAAHGSMENIIKAAKSGQVKPKRFNEPIVAMEPQLLLNVQLTELNRTAKLEWWPSDRNEKMARLKLREWKFSSMLTGMEFQRLTKMGDVGATA